MRLLPDPAEPDLAPDSADVLILEIDVVDPSQFSNTATVRRSR